MATEIRIEPLFDALKQPLALVEKDERRRAIETYVEAARVPLERAVHDLLSQLVEGIAEKTGDHYQIRLSYHASGLALDIEEKVQEGDESRWSAMEGDVDKITIRIPAELKDLAQQAAQRAGTSANSWFVKALARAVRNVEIREEPPAWREERRGRGNRMSGWVGGDDR